MARPPPPGRPELLAAPLPSRYYTDPSVFDLDRQAIFYRSWQCVGHVSQLPEIGDYLSFAVADENIAVVRGADRGLRAFYNVCRHRGHPVVEGRGHCATLVCPYHGWSYELDGRFRAAPAAGSDPAFESMGESTRLHLREVHLEEFCGLILVNLDDAPALAPASELYGAVREEIESFMPRPETYRFVCETSIEHHCNWKISVENYNECYHCPTVHRTSLTRGVLDLDGYRVEPRGHAISHLGRAQTQHDKQYDYSPEHGARGAEYGAWFLWPSVALTCYPGGYMSIRQWLPLGPRKTVYLYRWFSDGAIADADVETLMQTHRDTTGAEDAVVVAKVQRGMQSRAFSPGPYVLGDQGALSEIGVQYFQSLYREALGDAFGANA